MDPLRTTYTSPQRRDKCVRSHARIHIPGRPGTQLQTYDGTIYIVQTNGSYKRDSSRRFSDRVGTTNASRRRMTRKDGW